MPSLPNIQGAPTTRQGGCGVAPTPDYHCARSCRRYCRCFRRAGSVFPVSARGANSEIPRPFSKISSTSLGRGCVRRSSSLRCSPWRHCACHRTIIGPRSTSLWAKPQIFPTRDQPRPDANLKKIHKPDAGAGLNPQLRRLPALPGAERRQPQPVLPGPDRQLIDLRRAARPPSRRPALLHGLPEEIVLDNRPEGTSRAMFDWSERTAAVALESLPGSALPLIAQFKPEDSSSPRP
jgi:hypothetical protein